MQAQHRSSVAALGLVSFTLLTGRGVARDELVVERFPQNPILSAESVGDETAYNFDRESDARPFVSLAGPSLVRVPDWVAEPLGRYYLYFAHHKGGHIRMAYADELAGPWTVFRPGIGVLRLADVRDVVEDHIASPDVHVDFEHERFVLYFHGPRRGVDFDQRTWVAMSRDGLSFERHTAEILGEAYFRVFRWGGYDHSVARLGPLYRSREGLHDFQPGPQLFTPQHRHFATLVWNNRLSVFFSKKNDRPERLKMVTVELTDDWSQWTTSGVTEVLSPTEDYETSHGAKLLDPFVYEEDGRFYLLYSVSQERGIAIARLHVPDWTGLNVSRIRARSSAPYRVDADGIALGDPVFIDSDVVLQRAPASVLGTPRIPTATADWRGNPFARFLSFEVNRPVVVLVAHDDRFADRPHWLEEWQATGESLVVGDGSDTATLSLFEQAFPPGCVVLGGNAPDGAPLAPDRFMYVVSLRRND